MPVAGTGNYITYFWKVEEDKQSGLIGFRYTVPEMGVKLVPNR